MKDFLGYGRSRSLTDSNVLTRHFNPYVNCLHSQVGTARENMEVLIAEFDMSEIKYIGQMSSSQNSRVIDPSGISYAVTNGHKDGEPKIIERDTPMKGNYEEPRICTMVGRDSNNPSSRVRSDHYEQFLEMGDDVSNTLTSVQKDNLVAEPQVLTPKRTDFGKQVRKQYESGALDMSRHDMTELEPRTDGVSNTLTSVQKDNLVAEPTIIQNGHGFNKGGEHYIAPTVTSSKFQDNNFVAEWKTVIGSKQENSFLGDVNGECPCVTSACGAGGGMTPMITDAPLEQARTNDFREQVRGHQPLNYRIRKLTPRECFRLMGVSETDIDKIQQSGVSQSQQYKMAGNSIVVDCLFHIFRKMFAETHDESRQLSLF